jgi:tyrosyl-tRNA synthetase
MPDYFRLATDLSDEEISRLMDGSPRVAKGELASALVRIYHGEDAARGAAEEFDRIFRDKGLPDEIEESTLPEELLVEGRGIWIVKALQHIELATSASEARRLIKGGGVRVDDERVSDDQQHLAGGATYLLQVGKRRFHRVRVP